MTVMAYSTTTTSSYVLSKYSRSYPTTGQPHPDWQHFTNPDIGLFLDVTKNNNSELQEVRLRVLWKINDGSDSQPQVVFEDIELLSFSTLATNKITEKNHQSQGLPLKAVYRDNLVGIRYLHPKDTVNSNPTYRRFQVTLASAALTSEFINSICTVCPCKLNLPSVPNINPIQAPPRNLLPKTRDLSQLPSQINIPLPPRPTPVSGCLAPLDKSGFHMPLSSSQFTSLSQQEKDIFQLTSSPVNVHSEQSQFCNIRDAGRPLGYSNHLETSTRLDGSQQHSQLCLPESQVSSQDRQLQNLLTSGSPRKSDDRAETATDKIKHELLSALQEFQNTELYDLSPDALEEIVGEIVHEKGFPQLLESLEKLWAIKNLAKVYT